MDEGKHHGSMPRHWRLMQEDLHRMSISLKRLKESCFQPLENAGFYVDKTLQYAEKGKNSSAMSGRNWSR